METINDLLKKRKTSITSLLTQSVAPISITQAAIDKANYISKRLCELMRERLEVSFFMTSDNVGEQGDLVISDMYIAHEQKVWPDYCEIKGNGNIRSFRDIADNQHRVIAGLGHSHAQMETSYSKRDIKTLSEIVKSWGVSKTLSLNNDIPGEVTPIIPLDAHEKIALKLKFPGEIPIILKSDLLDIFKYEKLLKFHWEISVPTEVTVQYLYGLTFNAHGSDPYCVIAYKLPDDDIGIVRDVGYKIVEHPYQVAVDPTQIDSELKERVLNLREKADEQKKLLSSSEDNAKEFYQTGIETHQAILSFSPEYIAYYPRYVIPRLRILLESIKSLEKIIENNSSDNGLSLVQESEQARVTTATKGYLFKLWDAISLRKSDYAEDLDYLNQAKYRDGIWKRCPGREEAITYFTQFTKPIEVFNQLRRNTSEDSKKIEDAQHECANTADTQP